MANILFFSFLASLVICMALIPPLTAYAGRFQILDLPGDRKMHHVPIARVGGIAFAVGVFLAILLWAPKDEMVIACLLGGLTILLFGVWDDRVGLDVKTKFLGQVLAAAIVVVYGGVRVNALPFFPDTMLPAWVSISLTCFVLVGVTNAINLADGLDGLAGGLSLLSFGGMAYLAYLSGDLVVLVIVVSMLGGLLGFLRFNTYPARVFMGDGGSQFLGFYLGVAAILLTDPARGPYTPALALMILGVPLLDTAGVIGQRLAQGRSPFAADKNHIHHKLLAVGFVHNEAVLIIYAFQAGMVMLAYLLRWQGDMVLIAVYTCLGASVLVLFVLAGRSRFHWARTPETITAGTRDGWKGSTWLTGLPLTLLGVTVTGFLTASVFLPRRVPVDFGYIAAALLVVMIVGLAMWPQAAPLLVRFGLYVGSAFVMYLSEQTPHQTAFTVFFLGVAALVVMTIRFNRTGRFETTPLDYLLVFLALIIPLLPEIRVGETQISFLAAKLVILFFSYELLLNAWSQRLFPLGIVSVWLLFGLGVRAWW